MAKYCSQIYMKMWKMEEIQRQEILYARFAGFIISPAFNNRFYRLLKANLYREKENYKTMNKNVSSWKADIELLCLYLLNNNWDALIVGPYGPYEIYLIVLVNQSTWG